jgi:hypothetical protein
MAKGWQKYLRRTRCGFVVGFSIINRAEPKSHVFDFGIIQNRLT